MIEFHERTKKHRIVRAIRLYIWLRSIERSQALKRTHYCCEVCGVKQSRAKGKEQVITVHHKNCKMFMHI